MHERACARERAKHEEVKALRADISRAAALRKELETLKARLAALSGAERSSPDRLRMKHRALRSRVKELEGEVERLRSLNRQLQQATYGRRSERRCRSQRRGAPVTAPGEGRSRGQQPGAPGHGRTPRPALPMVEQILEPPARWCAHCARPYVANGASVTQLLEAENKRVITVVTGGDKRRSDERNAVIALKQSGAFEIPQSVVFTHAENNLTTVFDAKLNRVYGVKERRIDFAAILAAAIRAAARSPQTRRAYVTQWSAWASWCEARGESAIPAKPLILAAYLAERAESASIATVRMARAAVAFVHKAKGEPSPITDDVLEVLRGLSASKAAERGRGQARGITRDDFAVILARAGEPRKLGRGMETAATAAERAQVDRAIAGVLFHAGLRRSEAAALQWGDVEPAASIPGALTIRVRTSKTNRDGEATDIRLVKNGAAAALTALRPDNASPSALSLRWVKWSLNRSAFRSRRQSRRG